MWAKQGASPVKHSVDPPCLHSLLTYEEAVHATEVNSRHLRLALLFVQMFGKPLTDLIEDHPHRRPGPWDVRRWNGQTELGPVHSIREIAIQKNSLNQDVAILLLKLKRSGFANRRH